MNFPESLKERFLSYVLGFMAITKQIGSGANEATPMSGDEQTESIFVPLTTPSYPLALLSRLVDNRSRKVFRIEHCLHLGHVIVHDGPNILQSSSKG